MLGPYPADSRHCRPSCPLRASANLSPLVSLVPGSPGSPYGAGAFPLGEEPANDNELKATLKPFPNERMTAWLVGRSVGNVKNDVPDLIEREAEQASLI